MPGTVKKRPMTRRRRRKPRPNRLLKVPFAFTPELDTKITYVTRITVSAGGAGLLGWHNFRGNDISDCDASGVGHAGFMSDQFAGLYSSCCVYASKIDVEFASSNASLGPQKVYIRARKSAAAPSDPDLEEERKYSKRMMINSGTSAKPGSLSSYNSAPKQYGQSLKAVLTDDTFSSATVTTGTSTPVNQWYWTLSNTTFDATQTSSVYYNVKITYWVRYKQRKAFAKS